MVLQCGIVGLPNVGKTSLFNALTAAEAAAENFPFCTLDANVGVAALADDRLSGLAKIARSAKTTPASVRLVDIAGLVKGASKGKGLGNRFLGHIREMDGLVHVLRCFPDSGVSHVAGRIDPALDAETLELELILADLQSLANALVKLERRARAGDKKAAATLSLLQKVQGHLNAGRAVRFLPLGKEEQSALDEFSLLSAKPLLYCANTAEEASPESAAALARAKDLAWREKAPLVELSAKLEAELAGLASAGAAEMLAEIGCPKSGLARLAQAAYELLDLVTFFTVGSQEARAWEIPAGTTALQAAACVHTDMQRGFIRAEIIAAADYLRYGGEAACRGLGKMRLERRDHVIRDGDVVHFRFST